MTRSLVSKTFLSFLCAGLFGCATGKCLQSGNTGTTAAGAPGVLVAYGPGGAPQGGPGAAKPAAGAKESMKPESKLDKVKVYKSDGSLQCGQGKTIPVSEMQKELDDIKVYSSASKNDGMMRIQVCGSPTGNSNVYEIDRKNLEAAVKKGFKEWTFDN